MKEYYSQVQAKKIGFLRRAGGVILRIKVCSCQIRKALNVEPLLSSVFSVVSDY